MSPAAAAAPLAFEALGKVGVAVDGLDLPDAPDELVDLAVGAMRDAGGVLVVRGQDLAPAHLERALMRFARHFGEPLAYDRWPGQSPGVPGCPHLATLGNYKARADGEFGMECKAGDPIAEYKPAKREVAEWHTDGSFLAKPKVAICLYAPLHGGALPPEGGETGFASCGAAYAALPEERRAELLKLGSVHSWEAFMRFLEARDPTREKVTAEDCAKKPDVIWPMVRAHPVSGVPSLYINPKNTRRVVDLATGESPPGMSDEDGVKMVRELGEHVLETGGVYRHLWKPGDLLIWDNRVLLHAATPFDAEKYERFLFRAEFPGEPVVRFEGPP